MFLYHCNRCIDILPEWFSARNQQQTTICNALAKTNIFWDELIMFNGTVSIFVELQGKLLIYSGMSFLGLSPKVHRTWCRLHAATVAMTTMLIFFVKCNL